jgi:hypothetical protein
MYFMSKNSGLFFLILCCNSTFCTRAKILVAAPFFVSNSILTGYCLYKVYERYSCSEKITNVEKCKQGILVVASVISFGYSAAVIIDNLD